MAWMTYSNGEEIKVGDHVRFSSEDADFGNVSIYATVTAVSRSRVEVQADDDRRKFRLSNSHSLVKI